VQCERWPHLSLQNRHPVAALSQLEHPQEGVALAEPVLVLKARGRERKPHLHTAHHGNTSPLGFAAGLGKLWHGCHMPTSSETRGLAGLVSMVPCGRLHAQAQPLAGCCRQVCRCACACAQAEVPPRGPSPQRLCWPAPRPSRPPHTPPAAAGPVPSAGAAARPGRGRSSNRRARSRPRLGPADE
jgi:hypothetical protein